MRIVRFHFESWQKEGSAPSTLTTNPSPILGNVVILSPFMRHRQRSPDPCDKYVKRFYSTLQTTRHGLASGPKEKSIRRTRSREYLELVRLVLWPPARTFFLANIHQLTRTRSLSAANVHLGPGRGQPADAPGPGRERGRRHDPAR